MKLKVYCSKTLTKVKPKELKDTKFISTRPQENTSFKLETNNLDLNGSNNHIIRGQSTSNNLLVKNNDMLKDQPSNRPLTSRSSSKAPDQEQFGSGKKDILFKRNIE